MRHMSATYRMTNSESEHYPIDGGRARNQVERHSAAAKFDLELVFTHQDMRMTKRDNSAAVSRRAADLTLQLSRTRLLRGSIRPPIGVRNQSRGPIQPLPRWQST